ncbi:MAG: DUF6503 family protein [Bacteroidota bacterium]
MKITSCIPLICLSALLVHCGDKKKNHSTDPSKSTHREEKRATKVSAKDGKGDLLLQKCIRAHGGLERWKSFQGLEYTLDDNGKMVYQLTQLKDRRAYLKSKTYTVGYNGKVAWAIPDARGVSGKSAAFYYNLDFYFIGLPFLLRDPGVNTEYDGRRTINGKEYESLRITFGSEVGLTPEDIYYLYIDPGTHLLEILTYSISYFDPEKAAVNSAKVYFDYRNIQGLMMPHKMENFEWKDFTMGKSKNHLRRFSNIHFLDHIRDETVFEVPEGAIIEVLAQ